MLSANIFVYIPRKKQNSWKRSGWLWVALGRIYIFLVYVSPRLSWIALAYVFLGLDEKILFRYCVWILLTAVRDRLWQPDQYHLWRFCYQELLLFLNPWLLLQGFLVGNVSKCFILHSAGNIYTELFFVFLFLLAWQLKATIHRFLFQTPPSLWTAQGWNNGPNFSSSYNKMSSWIFWQFFFYICLWGFLVGVDREFSFMWGDFPWSIPRIWTKNGSVLFRFLWYEVILRSKMPTFYSIKWQKKNNNHKIDNIKMWITEYSYCFQSLKLEKLPTIYWQM